MRHLHLSHLLPRAAAFSALFALALPAFAQTSPPATDKAADKPGDKAQDKIAVLPLEIGGGIIAGRQAIEGAVVKGLVQTQTPVVAGPEVATTLAKAGARVTCVDAACWKAAGRALGAKHLVAGTVERKAGKFEVEFRLIDAVGGRVLQSSDVNRCDVSDCSVAELCRLTVHELARTGFVRGPAGPSKPDVNSPPAKPAAEPLVATPPPASPATSEPTTLPPVAPPPMNQGTADLTAASSVAADDGRSWPSWYPVTAVVTGLAAGAVGGFLIYKDDQCSGNPPFQGAPCPRLLSTLWGGVATAGAGAILLASGIVVGLLDQPDENTTSGRSNAVRFLVGPGSVGMSGRF